MTLNVDKMEKKGIHMDDYGVEDNLKYFKSQLKKRIEYPPVIKDDLEKTKLEDYDIDLSAVIQGIFSFKGGDYSLQYFPFWTDIFDSPRLTQQLDQVQRKMVWLCSRQIAKSVGAGALAAGFCITRKNFTTLICQPTDTQISRFSVDVLKRFNLESLVADVWYRDTRRTVRQVKHMGYSGGSHIILANIYSSVLSARGSSADVIILDEFGDIPEDHAIIVMNTIRRSPWKVIIYSGTPRSQENEIQIKFDNSTQNEWMVPCPSCGYWNGPLGGDGTDKKIHNLGKKGVICDKCGNRIYPEDGEWVPTYPDREIDGYHMNELMVVPTWPGSTSWKEMIYRFEHDPQVSIWNEILGISFADEVFPISLSLIARNCDSKRKYIRTYEEVYAQKGDYTFAGLDWATETSVRGGKQSIKSYTVLTIGAYNFIRQKIIIQFVRRYYDLPDFDADKPNEVLEDIISWLSVFKITLLGCDYGVGHKENQRIKDKLGIKRVMEIQYLADKDFYEYHANANKWLMNRTYVIDDLIEAIKIGEFEFAKLEGETSEYVSDLTGVFKYQDSFRRTRYGKKQLDDWLHSLAYLLLAMRYSTGSPKFEFKMME